MSEQPQSSAPIADDLLDRTIRQLIDLRFDTERKLGRVLAELHIEKRRRDKAAKAARGAR